MFYLEMVALSVFGKLDFKIRVFFKQERMKVSIVSES